MHSILDPLALPVTGSHCFFGAARGKVMHTSGQIFGTVAVVVVVVLVQWWRLFW